MVTSTPCNGTLYCAVHTGLDATLQFIFT